MGQLWLIYGELWGILGIYVTVSADDSVFLIPFVLIPADMSDSDFHAFNKVLYVRLLYLYKPPREYLSQCHLARVMKKQDIKCLSSTEIGLVGARGHRGGGWVCCTAALQLVPPGHREACAFYFATAAVGVEGLGELPNAANTVVRPPDGYAAHHLGCLNFVMNGVVLPPVAV